MTQQFQFQIFHPDKTYETYENICSHKTYEMKHVSVYMSTQNLVL